MDKYIDGTVMIIPKGANIQLTDNFNSREADCQCSLASCKTTKINVQHLARLQELRNLVGPVAVNSWYRCPEHNTNVGGSKTSKHLTGAATDIRPLKETLTKLTELAKGMFEGIGTYVNRVHIDTRPNAARWEVK